MIVSKGNKYAVFDEEGLENLDHFLNAVVAEQIALRNFEEKARRKWADDDEL